MELMESSNKLKAAILHQGSGRSGTSQVSTSDKELTCQCRRPKQETWVQSLGQEDSLEEGMAAHTSVLAWIIPWTEEYGP